MWKVLGIMDKNTEQWDNYIIRLKRTDRQPNKETNTKANNKK